MKIINKSFLSFFLILFCLCCIFSQVSEKTIRIESNTLPVINNLSSNDVVFLQFSQTCEYNEKEIASGKVFFEEFYSYICKKSDSLISIHADSGIPYDTIATLNSFNNIKEGLTGKKIILPTVKGIFIPINPKTSFEFLLSNENKRNKFDNEYEINGRKFFFLNGERFSQTQRAFFLDTSFRFPLDTRIISSDYGFRDSPVYGIWKFHKGIDFAAHLGDKVYACKQGIVYLVIKNDNIFGNYVILAHKNGMTSVYAHLSKSFVTKGQYLKSGDILGEVGQTGAATGPHLHFEIRQNGESTNPNNILPKK